MPVDEDEIICFKVLRQYWEAFGLFPKRVKVMTTYQTIRNCVAIFLFQSPFLFGLLGYIYTAAKGGIYNSIIFATYAFNFVETVQICTLVFMARGKETMEFLYYLGSTKYGKPKNFDFYLNITEKATAFLYKAVIIEALIIAVTSYWRNAFCDEKNLLNDDRMICGLMVPLWYPFKIPNLKIILSIYLLFFLPQLAAQTCGNIIYFGSIIPNIQRLYQLRDFIEELNFEDEFASHERLKFCSKYHSEITEIITRMHNTVGYIMSPAQYVLVVVMLGILQYQAVHDKNIMAGLQLVVWFFIQLGACIAGQQLENASLSITEAVYNISWYDMHPSLRTSYKLFQVQSQKIMQFKIQPLTTMNMEYFYKVMQRSYSFLMFLSNFD